jgi:hypothetical protein
VKSAVLSSLPTTPMFLNYGFSGMTLSRNNNTLEATARLQSRYCHAI